MPVHRDRSHFATSLLFVMRARAHDRFIREEGYTPDEAEAKWQEDLANPQIKRQSKHGVLKLAVQGHETIVSQQGVRKQQVLTGKRQEADNFEDRRSLQKRAKRFHDATDAQFNEVGGDMFRDGAAACAGAGEGVDNMEDIFGSEDEEFSEGSGGMEGRRSRGLGMPGNQGAPCATPTKIAGVASSAAPSSPASLSGLGRRPGQGVRDESDGDAGGMCYPGAPCFQAWV